MLKEKMFKVITSNSIRENNMVFIPVFILLTLRSYNTYNTITREICKFFSF